jgi:Na+/alanine symporter
MAAAAGIAVLVMGLTLALASLLPDLLANPLTGALILFAAATAHHGARVGRKTYLLDMATQDNRAQYTAVSNTVMGTVLLSGAALGVVDTVLGTNAVLVLLALVGLAAIARCYTLPHVDEPG